jgi:uncharacterized protein YndB with AHSA1/START domain
MGAKRFEVRWEGEIAGSPEQVWKTFTEGTAGYLWPVQYEPREGGAETGLSQEGGTVTAWEPDRHFTTVSGEGGYVNRVDYVLTPTDGGTLLQLHHQTGVDEDEWDDQLEACQVHTELYHHSLRTTVEHFAGRTATYVAADGPMPSPTDGDLAAISRALGLPGEAEDGDVVHLEPDGLAPIDGVVDWRTDRFLGVRTPDALVRVYARDGWGWPTTMAIHRFDDDVDQEAEQQALQQWLDEVLVGPDQTEIDTKDEVA